MTTLFLIITVIGLLILCGCAGYLGWYLSHKSFSDGFQMGYGHGREEMYQQLTPVVKTKPDLRPIK